MTDLESSALTGSGLLLDGHDLENLVLQDLVCQEEVDDLKLLKGTEQEITDCCYLSRQYEHAETSTVRTKRNRHKRLQTAATSVGNMNTQRLVQ